ncbi:3-dehydroquinate synthase [Candidatus Aerophobetes bacterium]|nr:3-dehydroquinate synthase [Candidatus Aerophobetes bacterium]
MNIVLVGFMGTGKSRIGKLLARRLGMEYLDTDEIIEKRERKSIYQIFKEEGEDYFRKVESEVVEKVAKLNGYVIATGGGVVLKQVNVNFLRKKGFIICLTAEPQIIWQRVKHNNQRPLLSGFSNPREKVRKLLNRRAPFYSKADITIDTSYLSEEKVVDKIVNSLPKERIQVNLGYRSYPIFIGSNIDEVGVIAKGFNLSKRILIVSDTRVWSLYGKRVKEALKEANFEVEYFQIPPGERYKSLAQTRKLYNACLDFKLERNSSLLALGGGVVGDLTGFVAATYLRGINFLLIPTTLLAQVDASVGGKVAVNLSRGKNLVGSFYQPRFVLIDPEVLLTLPPRRVREGMAEVIKSAIIKDKSFFSYIERNLDGIRTLDPYLLRFIIGKSLRIKVGIVEEDEREEKGIRQILNFGHTVAHGIEAAANYKRYTHGEAVAVGMIASGRIAVKMGYFPLASFLRLENLLKKVGLPTTFKEIDKEKFWQALFLDKKVKEGRINFVLLKGIGEAFLTPDVPTSIVRKVIEGLEK